MKSKVVEEWLRLASRTGWWNDGSIYTFYCLERCRQVLKAEKEAQEEELRK